MQFAYHVYPNSNFTKDIGVRFSRRLNLIEEFLHCKLQYIISRLLCTHCIIVSKTSHLGKCGRMFKILYIFYSTHFISSGLLHYLVKLETSTILPIFSASVSCKLLPMRMSKLHCTELICAMEQCIGLNVKEEYYTERLLIN